MSNLVVLNEAMFKDAEHIVLESDLPEEQALELKLEDERDAGVDPYNTHRPRADIWRLR